ncbi:bifunctional TH2 protein, mitochondrial-like isoform X1 [Andrographis paniculata]|uniref:bifunctional TH2 protein, mitochondrial-like isoform X1 n=1 Tax=Andrographis paniculata TaxID=175694 RepID=UPI0021E7B821|nr:bifunctional TH2 protein, mitochondrial-like isoform X1 [Andrographis paniculata]XP_051143548.1 bifunctional TH2 protein, mitochondrial-like isoform X1 [Andrographis paniculata]
MGSLKVEERSLDEGGIAKRLWNKLETERASALYSPYVLSLAAGDLHPNSFLHCISQDVYFLQAFAQAYELAEEYADDEEDKEAIAELRKRVLNRLRNQDALISEWGFNPSKETSCDDATAKYTEFLMETASGKVGGEKLSVNIVTPFEKTKLAAYTLSAISPCMRLYSFISKEIVALLDSNETDHIYKKWLSSLSSPKFEASAMRIEELLDKLSVSLTGEELDVVERLYHRAMKLELEFIWSQSVHQRTVVPFLRLHDNSDNRFVIFSGFDVTCTSIDSSALLAELAVVAAAANASESQLLETPAADTRAMWNNLFSQYAEEYQQCIEGIIPGQAGTEKTLQEGYDYDGLCKTLEQISNVEKMATERVINSNVLSGLNLEDIKRAGERLTLQDGCEKFVHDVTQSESSAPEVHILSYCWCGDLIWSAFSSVEQTKLNIHSNDLEYKESISTGKMITNMLSPTDKLDAFNNITNNMNGSKLTTVYIGGSVGDLLCLLEADIGIVIGSDASLTNLATQFGIMLVPLFSGLVSKQREVTEGGYTACKSKDKGAPNILYTVSNWDEIYMFVLGR